MTRAFPRPHRAGPPLHAAAARFPSPPRAPGTDRRATAAAAGAGDPGARAVMPSTNRSTRVVDSMTWSASSESRCHRVAVHTISRSRRCSCADSKSRRKLFSAIRSRGSATTRPEPEHACIDVPIARQRRQNAEFLVVDLRRMRMAHSDPSARRGSDRAAVRGRPPTNGSRSHNCRSSRRGRRSGSPRPTRPWTRSSGTRLPECTPPRRRCRAPWSRRHRAREHPGSTRHDLRAPTGGRARRAHRACPARSWSPHTGRPGRRPPRASA